MQPVSRRAMLASLTAVSAACSGGGTPTSNNPSSPEPPPTSSRAQAGSQCDWPRFGFDADRRNAGPSHAGVPAVGLDKPLTHRTLHLPGTVDSSPIYLH